MAYGVAGAYSDAGVPVVPGVGRVCRLFDRLARGWESHGMQRALGTLLVLVFLASLAVIELNRLGFVPGPLAGRLPMNHFSAVGLVFGLLLVVEVVGLVFALARSVGKQFELLSLIFLRKAFVEFGGFGDPIEWELISHSILHILSDMVGALLIFVVIGVYYRVQRHQPITADEQEQVGFVCAKKFVAMFLLAAFVWLGAQHLLGGAEGASTYTFFQTFYTVLILSDVLIVLVSLRYTSEYRVIFRNSGFTASTIVIRLALTAPPYVNILLGLGAVLIALELALAYNAFAPVLAQGGE